MSDVLNQNETLDVVYAADVIAARLEELAREISGAEEDQLLVIAVLKGSFVFAADLIRALHRAGASPEVDFITLSSYRKNRVSLGSVQILRDVEMEVRDRSVLLVDDVLDSGRTLAFAKDLMAARGARSIRTCVLLNKQTNRAVDVAADYRAFDCDDAFMVGYGMDVAHRFRELPYVGRIVKRT
ncbi:MAG: hypoxanthine phosphoribosyltransferase [Hyphomicrobiaceae bacterium]